LITLTKDPMTISRVFKNHFFFLNQATIDQGTLLTSYTYWFLHNIPAITEEYKLLFAASLRGSMMYPGRSCSPEDIFPSQH
jgi:hypothetical protein